MGSFFTVKRLRRWSLVFGIASLALCTSASLFADFNRLSQLQNKGFSISAEARLLDARR